MPASRLAVTPVPASPPAYASPASRRALEVTYKTAWFLAHRIREAMRSGDLALFGGNGSIVEIDETYIGRKAGMPVRRAYHHKMKVLALVCRATGRSRAMVVDRVNQATVMLIVRANVELETRLVTDESAVYWPLKHEYQHAFVNHQIGEYGRGEVHSNTVEGKAAYAHA